MFDLPLKDGMTVGPYPERKESIYSRLDEICLSALTALRRMRRRDSNRFDGLVGSINRYGSELGELTTEGMTERVARLRYLLRKDGLQFRLVAQAFAIVREVAQRTIGLRHHDVQLIGGWVLLSGRIAEMETGEGKTLTATLPACVAALAGIPVHVITVNDYLAQRDADRLAPVYEALGLSVGVATGDVADEARRRAYRCDVVYCTNKTLAFDYLRDRIALAGRTSPFRLQVERLLGGAREKRLFLKGLCFGIVDEADSVLIDEARTPLVISRESDDESEVDMIHQALEYAGALESGKDFRISESQRSVHLTDVGRQALARLTADAGPLWASGRRREEWVSQALAASHLFVRDKQYLVRDGKVQIIDEYTGRLMPDRSWERGLHQLVEAKEGCAITARKETLARISYQRFFRRYLRLAGMTGTASETAAELEAVYELPVMAVPTHRPGRRIYNRARVFPDVEAKWQAIRQRVAELHARGIPVLIGTRSVEASEHASELLREAGIPHEVLNARQDEREAEIVAQAGERGRVTIATNMAGRGTDISLGSGVEEAGGLHVILTERHEARRIDRQLAGRCARQGDPGCVDELLSLDDELVKGYGNTLVTSWLRERLDKPGSFMQKIAMGYLRLCQFLAERQHSRARRYLLKTDRQMDAVLAFAGSSE